jgi:hypothetical protein
MSEPTGGPATYRVIYSEFVRGELLRLFDRAKARGLGRQVYDAVQAINDRLRIYPQFGEPLYDLKLEPGQVWLGTVPPLTVRYVLIEARRLVMVVIPFTPLPGCGLEA